MNRIHARVSGNYGLLSFHQSFDWNSDALRSRCIACISKTYHPPPPSISNINEYGITDERLWTKDKAAEVRGAVSLTGDRAVRGLHIYEPNVDQSWLNLNGKTLTVGHEGIFQDSYNHSHIVGEGLVTASGPELRVSLMQPSGWSLHINSVIANNQTGEVGVFISGVHPGFQHGYLALGGSKSNTFTGVVTISGKNGLALIKSGGATAVNGDIYVKDNARLGLYLVGNQIEDSATVTLSGENTVFYFARENSESISEAFHKLVVSGSAVMELGAGGSELFPHGQRHLYLDDLEIKKESSLFVREWAEGRDHLLVRRDSEHLEESLKRMRFEGYDPNAIHLVDYNKDYWEINALPEPATYGAGLILGAVGVVHYRRRRKRRAATTRFPSGPFTAYLGNKIQPASGCGVYA